jgi:predicted RNA binding protein YcfA (HicA-like mRNA interferase family)
MKVLKVKKVISALEADGWFLYKHNGTSHRQFKHPNKKGKVTINGKLSDDVFGFILKSIEKQSGVKF